MLSPSIQLIHEPDPLSQIIELDYQLTGNDHLSVISAGNLNGDHYDDVVLTGRVHDDQGNPVLVSEILLGSSDGLAESASFSAAPSSLFPVVPLGNVNGDVRTLGKPPVARALDDLGRLWLTTISTLSESDHQLAHVTGQIWFGAADGIDSVDLVIEPQNPFYFDPAQLSSDVAATIVLRPHQFGSVGDVNDDGIADLAIADGLGSGVTVLLGRARVERDLPKKTDTPQEAFTFDLAAPLVAHIESGPGGVGLADAPDQMDLDQAYWLAGSASNEQLSAAQDVGDFNGDGADDLLITGSRYSYLILGPATITDQELAKDHATAVFDIAKLGHPAQRMSDLDGDGQTELIFVKSESSPGAIPPIPPTYSFRVVHSDWLENKDDVQSRLIDELAPTLVIQGAAGNTHAEISVHGLDFDGDDFQDLLVTGASRKYRLEHRRVDRVGQDASERRDSLDMDSHGAFEHRIGGDSGRCQPTSNAVATEALAGVAIASDASPGIDYTATVAGDINGDGLEDIVLANSLFVNIAVSGKKLPPFGRVYVVYGTPTGTGPLIVNLGEHVVYQDFDLGAGLAPLGDLNRDGYDDLAILRGEETAQYASLEVFLGSDALAHRKGNLLQPLAGDISIRRTDADNVPAGLSLLGLLDVTAGDFDGDGHMDLVIGETERMVTTATSQVLDRDARGHLYVYWSVQERGYELLLADADVVVDGEAAFDQFGRLPSAPGLDLNGDHYADLIVGASMSHVLGTPTLSNAGKMYFLPGGPRQFELPPSSSMPVLSNNSFTGSGDFADGTAGTVLDQVPMGDEKGAGWFQFTTLGDGVGGNYVRVAPAYEERSSQFIEPIDALATSPTAIDHTSPTFTLGGSDQAELIMELDLAGLLPNMEDLGTDHDRLASLQLQLDYFNLSGQQDTPYDLHRPLSTAPIAFDERLVFAAKRSATSQQSVWSTDTQSAQLVTSYAQGLVEQLTAAGNLFYFTVDDGAHGANCIVVTVHLGERDS